MPRNRHLFLADAFLLLIGTLTAFAIRFEGIAGLQSHLHDALPYLLLTLPLRLGIFAAAGTYRRLWRYASAADLAWLVMVGATAAVANLFLGAVVLPGLGLMQWRVSLAVLALDGAATIGLTALVRLASRQQDRRKNRRPGSANWRPVLIAGAGAAGRMMAIELRDNPDLQLRPIAFLDDDPSKAGQQLVGVPIVGTLAELEQVATPPR